MWAVFFILIGMLSSGASAKAQEMENVPAPSADISCTISATGGQTHAYVACLEEKLRGLEHLNEAYRSSLLSEIENNRKTLDQLQAKLTQAMNPEYVLLTPFVYSTIRYWHNRTRSNEKICGKYPTTPEHYTMVDRRIRRKVKGRGTCQVAPYCDGTGERCEDVVVEKICLVRNDLYKSLTSQFRYDHDRILDRFCL